MATGDNTPRLHAALDRASCFRELNDLARVLDRLTDRDAQSAKAQQKDQANSEGATQGFVAVSQCSTILPLAIRNMSNQVVVYGLPSLSLYSRTSPSVTRSRSATIETRPSM